MFMNEYEIEDASIRYRHHPVLGPATQTLTNLVRVVNCNSDGWPYWSAPSKAAKKLMVLIEGDDPRTARFDDYREDATVAKLRAAYTPIKSFLTRRNLTCELVEPAAVSHG